MVWREAGQCQAQVADTRQYLLPCPCPAALASLGCQRCGTAEGLWEAFPGGYEGKERLAAPQHVAPRYTASITRSGRELGSPGMFTRNCLQPICYGKAEKEGTTW